MPDSQPPGLEPIVVIAEPPLPPEREASPREQRVARFLLGVVLLGLGIFVLDEFIRPLVWSVVLAVATWRLYRRMALRFGTGKHNLLLPGLFTIVSTLVVLVPLVLIGYEISQEAHTVGEWIVQAREHGVEQPQALHTLPFGQSQVDSWWQNNLAKPEGAQALLGRADTEMMSFGRNYGSRVLHTVVNFGFEMLALFFLYRDGETLVAQLTGLSRRVFGPHGERVGRQIVASINGTVDGLVLVGLGVGLVLGIAYAVARVPHPGLLGALTALGAMIPSGAWIALAIACLLLAAAGKTVAAIVLAVFGAVVVFAADHFIRPVLIGGSTKLPFLWVLLGILGGVETFGLLGLFLGPAIMAALILLWREWVGEANPDPA